MLSVYRASHVRVAMYYVRTVAALCWSRFESAQPMRTVMSVSIKLDDHRLVVGSVAERVRPPQTPSYP